MGNILDYLDWRGDLTFEQSPFNEVDNLILSCFSYLDLDEITELKNGDTLCIKESLREIFHRKKRTGYESRKCVFAEYAGSS